MKQIYKIDTPRAKGIMMLQMQALSHDPAKVVTVDLETRKNSQNAAQWPILTAFAEQLEWPINGVMQKITADDWKNILTAAYRQEVPRVAIGLNGGIVMLGHRTREFKAKEWGEWMEFLKYVAAERGVKIPVSKREAEMYGY